MDIEDESLVIRDGEGDFDPARDTTVSLSLLPFYMQQTKILMLFLKKIRRI